MPKADPSSASPDNYCFFYTTNHVNGWASQWYPAPFTVPINVDGPEEEITFPSAEHWMMFQKAILFSDTDIARQVIDIPGTSKKDLARVKSLGRKVRNFDEKKWNAERQRIVLEGNLNKFRQNKALKEKLLATGTRQMVEASPRDKIWGIGFPEAKALNSVGRWGLNLLGKALDETRRILREEAVAGYQCRTTKY